MVGNFVYSEDLKALYGDELGLYSNLESSSQKKLQLKILQKQQVEVISKQGPYSIVRTLNSSGDYVKFIIESRLIKQEEIIPFREWCKPVLDKLMPKRWCIVSGVYLYLHYPKLVIQNSTGNKHTIYDLLVQVCLNNDTNGIFTDLRGARVSYSQEELAKSYVHSHLPSGTRNPQQFCRGGGSPFDKFIQSLRKLNSPEELELFLIQLEGYLSWESLEGRPHISINTLKSSSVANGSSRSPFSFSTRLTTIEQGLKLLKTNEKYQKLISLVGDRFIFDITLDPVGYQFELELTRELTSSYLSSYNETTGQYVTEESNSSNNNLPYIPDVENVVRQLNITPRIVNESSTIETKDVIVKRIGLQNLISLCNGINDRLLDVYKV